MIHNSQFQIRNALIAKWPVRVNNKIGMSNINDKWVSTYPKESLVYQAYQFAKEAHKNDLRKTGDPYISHCLAVAETIKSWGLDEASIATALLHDVVEDTKYNLQTIEKKFGSEVAFLVDGLTKIEGLSYSGNKNQAENMRKLILAISEDLRVVFIKLADRLHNMQTLKAMPAEKRLRIAQETSDIHAPLAYRLGMQKLSGELEDLAFPYLYPKEYAWLIKTVKEKYIDRQKYVERVRPVIEQKLKENGIVPLRIDARAKRYSSLYKKLLRYDMELEKIYDLVAIRIIVATVEDCYATLGIIHKYWPPMPNRFKDYIALPKPNGYRSLHTTVFCVDNKVTEIQIRTMEMHEENELGAAAHWAYQQAKLTKDYRKGRVPTVETEEVLWVKQLRNWQRHFADSEEFLRSLKVDFFKDRIFVITPEHDVIDLPVGATPVDFAYRIHSEIGNQCIGAKVNNKIVPLDYQLRSGDIVEIITQRGKKPSESWLEFVKTSLARSRIKSVLRQKNKNILKDFNAPMVEFKVTAKDRTGLLKDIAGVFAKLKINIHNISTQKSGIFQSLVIKCENLDQAKVEKTMVKLKTIPEVEEVAYRYLR